MADPVDLVVAGHTNTGKTSLLRTLTRDSGFGEVAERPGTTRHIESAALRADGVTEVVLHDTPGLEDSVELYDLLETLRADDRHRDGPERIGRFLRHPDAAGRFEQEAKVLRCMLAADAALYVVDARDPVLAKHRDELAILALCGRPLLPVLNFARSSAAREAAWREALGRIGLHAVVAFDTVLPEQEGEERLLGALGALLESRREQLEHLRAVRRREAGERYGAALGLVSETLLGIAALRRSVPRTERQTALPALQAEVRAREQACEQRLVALWGFADVRAAAAALPLPRGRWEHDLFSSEALRDAGIRLGSGVAAGAAAGLGIDLAFGGLTLGAAAALGAFAGGVWQGVGHYGRRAMGAMRGTLELTVDDAILRLLAVRQLGLVRALERRGHAAQGTLAPETDPQTVLWREESLPEPLQQARAHPEWAEPDESGSGDAARRAAALAALAGDLDWKTPGFGD